MTKLHTIVKKMRTLDWLIFCVSLCIVIFLIVISVKRDRWITIEFKVTLTPSVFPYNGEIPPYWIVNKIKPGDVQFDSIGKENLRIINVRSWGYQANETWISASVNASYKPKQKKYTFQYQPLEIGRSIDLTINGTYIHGIVTKIENTTDTRPLHDVIVKTRLIDQFSPYSTVTRGVDPWITDAIKAGKVMTNISGVPVAEIIDTDIKPADRIVTTSDGRIIIAQDPFKNDAYMTIKLKATKQNSTYFFLEDKAIIIGYTIPIYLDNILLLPVIMEIK